ncbi:MAG: cysteine--tRNA ligase [Deltaproteobacteria bacterium CG11_big_fil_rev_8_21_14_0_20_45_16]|nr:MAG: cysteine--tRNA ligase [Deltaproteobacteria bacterium CG11_big_fil_rev_8_21_14_0_20_45_16]
MITRDSQIYNSLSRRKEKLITRKEGKLSFYSCGPTVYNLIHVGNLRSALVADLFYRFWKQIGFDVIFTRNYTDVDDKIIHRAQEDNLTAQEVAEKFIEEVEKDYEKAGCLDPTYRPRVTDTMMEIIGLIEQIVSRGSGYVIDGNVVFSVDSFKDYGKLSGKHLEDLEVGARVDRDTRKRNPLDFYLWKASKEGEPFWESPWGKGRPGWHIECSAMIQKLLGNQIDVHHGGSDLIFPHHENEIAQSEAGSGKAPFVRYWLHHAFVTINQEKMSKSLGNVFSAREFLNKFSGEMARYMFLTPHYRSPIDFSENAVWSAAKALERIYEAKNLAEDCVALSSQAIKNQAFEEFIAKISEEFYSAMSDDFHTPVAISKVFDLIKEYNRLAYQGSNDDKAGRAKSFLRFLSEVLVPIFGFGGDNSKEVLVRLSEIQKSIKGWDESGPEQLSATEIESFISERELARKQKDFKRSDKIRDELLAKGVELKDTPLGPKWSYR